MYDTHADQATDLGSALALTAGSLNAFQRDLEARGLSDRVIVHVWSEFGRRGEENGSLGTDHGAAGGIPHRLPGQGPDAGRVPRPRKRARRRGKPEGDLRFRSFYCSLLEQWFNADAAAIIPNAASFDRPSLLK